MMPLYFLLCFFVFRVSGSMCEDRISCSNSLYQYENCLKTHDTAVVDRVTTLETEVTKLEEATTPLVSFFAGLKTDVKVATGHLTFDRDLLNEGHAYNCSTGVFTAPVHGVYSFTLTIGMPTPNTATDYLRLHIMKNKEIVGYLFIEWEDMWLKRSEATLVELHEGDQVHIMIDTAPAGFTTIAGTSYHSHFAGFLIGKSCG
ncbi:complement C1q-like protein 4 [Saccostrea echinata]|uniref:complement C1q-like protein 4 n=1 Tax=Saccostrea echinata TaxID=191078 RepID=UPI002A800866|nr:complement C1q-like protein 4 [Saccostrea echinata]